MKTLLKLLFFYITLASSTKAFCIKEDEISKIRINHCVLAQVGEKLISTFDLKQHLDLFFYANFPQYVDNPMARMQFYEAQWKFTLDELINTELMILEAKEKQVETADGEVHQEMHERYGPKVAKSLDKAGVAYNSAFKSIKNELIVRKILGHMVHAKAFQEVTPVKLEKAYQQIIRKNPEKTVLRYQILTADGDKSLDEAYAMLQDAGIQALPKIIIALKTSGINAKISNIYETDENQLAKSHQAILTTLQNNTFSKPTEQTAKRGDKLNRIFILHDKRQKLPSSFQEVEKDLTNELLNQKVAEGTKVYTDYLRKKHPITLSIPDGFVPFQM